MMTFDPDGLFDDEQFQPAKLEQHDDEVDGQHALIINELTSEQFKILSEGVFQALRPDPRNITGKIIGKISSLAACMVFVAGCLWLVSWLVTHLPGR